VATIKNNTKKETLTDKACICRSSFRKALGLMFSKKKDLIFEFEKEKRISLHMLFVFFPIWAIYLDKHKKVIAAKKLYPFISTFYPEEKARYIIEMTRKPNVSLKDRIGW
jgi:hypothetical protein